jgi:glucosamine-phosphate N-acetyltransferase
MIYCDILELNLNTIKDDYMTLLQQLTTAPDISLKLFINNIHDICQSGKIIVCHIDNKIIATGTILYETKIIHGGKKVGHIEDIVVDQEYRCKGIANQILKLLIEDSTKNNCYKVILDCNYDNIQFYEKNGFTHKNAQMTYYHNNLSESQPLDHFT